MDGVKTWVGYRRDGMVDVYALMGSKLTTGAPPFEIASPARCGHHGVSISLACQEEASEQGESVVAHDGGYVDI